MDVSFVVDEANRWLQDCLQRFCPVPPCLSFPQRTLASSRATSLTSLSPRAPSASITIPSPRAHASSPRPRAPINPRVDRPSQSTPPVEPRDTCTVLTPTTSCSNSSQTNCIDMASLSVSNLEQLQSTLPDHLQELFSTTCQASNLPLDVAHDIHTLLLRHQNTFAKSSTDLSFCVHGRYFLLSRHL